MCAEIVDLDAIVGGDLTFKYGGEELRIAGDIPTEKVFEVFAAFQELSGITEEGSPEEIERANRVIREQLLSLFQTRHPDMKVLPFGVRTTPVVIQEVLQLLGVSVRDDEGEGGVPLTPSTPKPKKPSGTARKTKAKPRSRRSNGSRSS